MAAPDYHQALNLARDGQWEESHNFVQQYSDSMACRIHAYLHRVEGDTGNAGYWYRRAGVAAFSGSQEEELAALYDALETPEA
ncbi:MAG: hypothetical protein OEN20_07605 [Gammaproteobacteria bacterium]|nr:hypothetical protein [Gammaproteobacteria bacterium]